MTVVAYHQQEVGTFADYLIGNGLSDRTAIIYVKRVDAAILWFVAQGADLVDGSAADLAAWALTLSSSTSARRQARSAVQYYLRWAGKNPAIARAIRIPPKPRYFCQAISEMQASALRKVAVEDGHPRGTAVLAGLYLALRASEIAGMTWDRFDRDLTRYTVTGKGNYTATLPVHPALTDYLEPLPTRYRFLFPGDRSRPHVHYATIWQWVRRLGEYAGIEDLRPHQLRHTAGATMNDRTGDLRATSEFLRHRRLETTMTYTRTRDDALRRAVGALDY